MAEQSNSAGADGRGSRLFRRLVMTAMVLGLIAAGRQWAIGRADREFEQRLMEADRQRN